MPVEMACNGVDRVGACVDEIYINRTSDVWKDDRSITRLKDHHSCTEAGLVVKISSWPRARSDRVTLERTQRQSLRW
jgi:hypothetical protein